MHAGKSGLIVLALTAVVAAQTPEPPLSDSRLTVHTLVREDVFAGFMANDMNRFARAERNIDALMAQRPDQQANLLAWKGATKLYRAVLAREAGNDADFMRTVHEARELWEQAAKLPTGNDGVPAIVGGSLATFADRLPQDMRATAWSMSYDNYALLWKLQAPAIEQRQLPVHFSGEVLAGLTQAAQRTGRSDEAAQYIDKMLTVLKDTPYESTAKRWKADPASASASNLTCKSCHEERRLAPLMSALNK